GLDDPRRRHRDLRALPARALQSGAGMARSVARPRERPRARGRKARIGRRQRAPAPHAIRRLAALHDGSGMNAAGDGDLRAEAEAFLVAEARLLDEGRFEDWLALFADDGFYWIPAAPGQNDPFNHLSIFYEDKSVLGMRIRRLAHPRAYSALPAPRTA